VPLRRVSAAEARDAAEAEASKLESKPPPNNAGCEAIDEATGRGDEPDEDAEAAAAAAAFAAAAEDADADKEDEMDGEEAIVSRNFRCPAPSPLPASSST
jgi:hypothetical protein